jgi:uncharacterized protein (TIGR02217 family)
MADFIEQEFPVTVAVGSAGGPAFSTDVDETEAGYEFRNTNWSQAKHKYTVSTGIHDAQQWAAVKDWFMKCAGRAYGFRFLDPGDHSSATDGWSDQTKTDQVQFVGDGSKKKFGLVKNYGGHSREILKPIQGSLQIAVAGVLKTETTHYTVDYTTGVVTLLTAPATGQTVTAGFLFHVPCRFESDELTASWSDANLVNGTIGIVEIKQRRTV